MWQAPIRLMLSCTIITASHHKPVSASQPKYRFGHSRMVASFNDCNETAPFQRGVGSLEARCMRWKSSADLCYLTPIKLMAFTTWWTAGICFLAQLHPVERQFVRAHCVPDYHFVNNLIFILSMFCFLMPQNTLQQKIQHNILITVYNKYKQHKSNV